MAESRDDSSLQVEATQVLRRDVGRAFAAPGALSPDTGGDDAPAEGSSGVAGTWLKRRQDGGSGGASSTQSFFRRRVAVFGFVGALCSLVHVIVESAVVLYSGGNLGNIFLEPNPIWLTLAVSATFLAIGLISRQCATRRTALRVLDIVGTFALCAIPPWLGVRLGLDGAGGAIMMLGAVLILMWRAATVPSHPLVTLPLSLGSILVNQGAAILGCPDVALEMMPVSGRVSWAILTALAAASASQVVFGLQRRAGRAERMGQYHIEHRLGAGGMGEVYLARHALMCRPVAVKILRADEQDPHAVERFEREVRLTSHLEHPNTIRIYDFGQTPDGRFFYVMERLRGIDLQRLIEVGGPVPPGRVVEILRQVCGSLQEAHGRGLVHRDIKPANVIVCVNGGIFDFIKVVDFGLVKEVSRRGGPDLTHEGGLMGTPLYLAPEVIRDPGSADARSDLYSLGGLAWTLLTGRRLFEADTMVEVLN
ncbi:MAG: serine/threonine-protein kinase, partial [Planctomycetota bacterium]